MADRIGVIRKGEIILVEDKAELMRKLGRKHLTLHLEQPLRAIPESLASYRLQLANDGMDLIYVYDASAGEQGGGIALLLTRLGDAGIRFKDLATAQSSLEDIFVDLVKDQA
jgi:ABC-2 type transport system ATP-binding protein